MALRYDVLALDLDGTLLNSEGRLSRRNAEALRRFYEAGGTVVLNSGRMAAAITPLYAQLGFTGPVIACNGALVLDEAHQVLLRMPLPAEYADEVLELALQHNWLVNYYLEGKLYNKAPHRALSRLYVQRTGSPMLYEPNLRRFAGRRPEKLLLLFPPEEARKQLAYFRAKYGEAVYITLTEPEYLEFMAPEANKGAALERLANLRGWDLDRCAGMGDSYNDMPLLETCGLKFAPANARDEVKALADVVLPSNDADAVAEAVDYLLQAKVTGE